MTIPTAPQYPASQPTSAPPDPPSAPAKFAGLAWSSLILGIVGVVFSPMPIINNLSALIAVVGIILGGIAVFGTRQILAGTGVVLCVLAVVFTMAKQSHDVAAIDKWATGVQKDFGGGPAAMGDVTATDCSVTSEYGYTSTHATVTIRNTTDRVQSYMATISVNDTKGTRIGEINTVSNSLAAGQSVTLSGVQASGTAVSDAKAGPAVCVVANVNRFPS